MNISSSSKSAISCKRCFDRKTKCDRRNPCSFCLKHNVECTPRLRKPSRRARSAKDDLIDERIRLYEAALREKGVDPGQITRTSKAQEHPQNVHLESLQIAGGLPPVTDDSGHQLTVFTPQLIHGQGGPKFVDNNLWSRLADEFHKNEDLPDSDSADESSDDPISAEGFSYILDIKSISRKPKHPPVDHIYQLWQIFLDNVNPLTKLVHVPSLQTAIEKAVSNIGSIPKGFEALMFSIYSIAILSLTEAECMERLGEPKGTLLPRFVGATKTALTRAGFMSSSSVVTLQALVLHIISIRDVVEPKAVWSLTGLAIRIADNMGMRVDGTILGLSPFETEIRRRIWWQLQMHDFRAAELSGQAKFKNFELDDSTPKKPANVNDSDLSPTMQQAAVDSVKPTEMIYCMLRSDLASFAAAQKAKVTKMIGASITSEEFSAMDDLKMKDLFIKELEDMIETKYLRFCDPSQPLQFLTLLGARLSTNLIRFIAHHPRRWATLKQVPLSEQQLIWRIAIGLLEQYDMMQSGPQLRRFAWCVPYFVQWHAVIHVLDTLRASPFHPDAANAWRLIDALYHNNPQMFMSIKKPIFMAVGNLCLNAYDARLAGLEAEGRQIQDQPYYVIKLREVRDSTKTKREKAIARRKEQMELDAERMTLATSNIILQPKETSEPMKSGETAPRAHEIHTQDDTFWLNTGLDSFGADGSTMDLDFDDILAQKYWLDIPEADEIDWTQWDALLTNVEPRRSNFAGSLEEQK
ncbi:hypothetical protein FKW77_005822 [Venturia effusa]|uniref:Zn(2)-C6 fungal-type domain-containing protein n=1 Tax=Venturia effusa TaxID=50376 RepID=A0A517L3E5_9PEZI|nr:hypothetical protein FKW77_005822 [Venturia effusa]